MNVKELMCNDVVSCNLSSTLDEVALKMWNNDCGAVPIVDDQNKPIGIITDRDIAIGAAMKHRSLGDITTDEVNNGRTVFTCQQEDDVKTAQATMQSEKIRRLPVVDEQGHLSGMVSIGDLVSYSQQRKGAKLPYADTMTTLKSVTGHH